MVKVAGFWRRLGGGLIDSAVILPVSLVLGSIVFWVSDIHLPPSLYGLDFWLDLLLAGDSAFVAGVVVLSIVTFVYVFVFQITRGRTLGMLATKTRIIDLYGDSPSLLRAAIRSLGYFFGVATLGLGFIWIAFDAEKRGVHDWISGTYVIKN